MQTNYDVIIIGGGPAGMTAGIYASRAGASVLMIEKSGVGGQVAITSNIANYPGFKNVDGFVLSQNMFEQATALGVETIFAQADKLILDGKENQYQQYTGDFELQQGLSKRSSGAFGQ